MKNWILINNTDVLPINCETDSILVSWVNLQHEKPFFGIDIIDRRVDFDSYERSYGRTVYRWKPAVEEGFFLPDEVIDLRSMKDYLNDINVKLTRNDL